MTELLNHSGNFAALLNDQSDDADKLDNEIIIDNLLDATDVDTGYAGKISHVAKDYQIETLDDQGDYLDGLAIDQAEAQAAMTAEQATAKVQELYNTVPPSLAALAAVVNPKADDLETSLPAVMAEIATLAQEENQGATPAGSSTDAPTAALTPGNEITQKAVTQMLDASNLVSKTVFLKTRFGSIGNSRKVSGSDVLSTDADQSLLKVNKQLLDSPELEAIKKADGKMRAWLYNTCLPFDMGVMLLPYGLIDNAVEKMNEYKTERAGLVNDFIKTYPAIKADAEKQLGTLYKESEYPSVADLKAKFYFDYQIMSFDVPGKLKSISAALFESEKEKQVAQMQNATEEITAIMRQTLLGMVQHLQAKLTPGDDGKHKILRESAVKNIQEFLTTFDLRNVTNDQELAAQVTKMRALLVGQDATAIRNSDQLKASLLSGMESIKDSLTSLVEEKPGRMFKDED